MDIVRSYTMHTCDFSKYKARILLHVNLGIKHNNIQSAQEKLGDILN